MKTIDLKFIAENKHIFKHKKCIFIVGAGISVESGIPDFRSPTGIFATLRQKYKINGRDLFTYNFGMQEAKRQVYLRYISTLKNLCDSSNPNLTHHFLTNFPRSRTYTQNIDGLEERSGMAFTKKYDTKGVYLHGNLSLLVCQLCGFKQSFTAKESRLFSEDKDIECKYCIERREHCIKNGLRKKPIGFMHPGIIHYQQIHSDGGFIGRLCEKDKDCDLLIVVGTSLAVDGVKRMVKMFARCENTYKKRILVNMTLPRKEWHDYFDFFYQGDCKDFFKMVSSFTSMPKYNKEINNGDCNFNTIEITEKEC